MYSASRAGRLLRLQPHGHRRTHGVIGAMRERGGMRYRTDPVVPGGATPLPRWRQGRHRRVPGVVSSWLALIAGLLGSYGASSLTLQALACVLGAAGVAGVIISATLR